VKVRQVRGVLRHWRSTIKADLTDVDRTDVAPAPQALPKGKSASKVWRTIRGFILWSHERGTVQYDVMVTLILLFVFFSPRLINFNDRPVERNLPATGVMVYPDGSGGLIYQVDARAVQPGDDDFIRNQLLRVIEPISGEISISRYEPMYDSSNDKNRKVLGYKVWVDRQ
jgi:hypothetical protein